MNFFDWLSKMPLEYQQWMGITFVVLAIFSVTGLRKSLAILLHKKIKAKGIVFEDERSRRATDRKEKRKND